MTQFLRDSLEGQTVTSILITASKESVDLKETLASLDFGKNAGLVKAVTYKNKKLTPSEMKAHITKLQLQVALLRTQIMKAGAVPNLIGAANIVAGGQVPENEGIE